MRMHSPDRGDGAYLRGLGFWVKWVVSRPWTTLALSAACILVASLYSSAHLRMNSDTRQLIRQDAPFRENYTRYLEAFPAFEDTTLVVLTSNSIAAVEAAQRRLADALREMTDVVASVYAAGADPFFEDHGLLYLDTDELDRVIGRLSEAQPALGALVHDPSLRGLLGELEAGVDALAAGSDVPAGFDRMADRVATIGRSLRAGNPRAVSWFDELLEPSATEYRLIAVQGRQEFSQSVPAEHLLEEIRKAARHIGATPDQGVTVRLTGMVPLAHEELLSLREGIVLSSALALTALVFILSFGLRSLRIIIATVLTLVASLSLTTAWAMLTIGEFNTVSAAFAVLLVGLGVDFGIHIGLRYEEETSQGIPVADALHRAAAATGVPISLCALTSAIGFAAFIPTEYRGLAALGVIASGGMLISLLASYTVLPAVLALAGPPSVRTPAPEGARSRLSALISGHAGAIVASAAVLAALAIPLASTRIAFDFSTLGLKDRESESMVTLRELHRDDIITDYSVTALSPDLASADALAQALESLPLVAEAQTPTHFVPADQDQKLAMLEEAAFFLEPVLYPDPPLPPPTAAQRLASIDSLLAAIEQLPAATDAKARAAAFELATVLRDLLDEPNRAARVEELEHLVVADLAERVDWLRRALSVGPVEFEDLPADLRGRLVSSDGQARIVALPAEDVSDVAALHRFVEAVQSVAPLATGRPVVEAGIGDIVVRSFRVAILIALGAIFLILLLTLRRVGDSLSCSHRSSYRRSSRWPSES